MASITASTRAITMPKARAFSGLRAMPAVFSKPTVDQKFLAVRKSVKAQKKSATALQAVSSMEVAQIAGEAGYIFGVASVMFGITLVGLAMGFVLLRVESLAEEGKI